jgi:hypothetical protein
MEKPLFVRQGDVAIQWHEAVALVRSVTDALETGRLRSIPRVRELALESDGSLHLTRGAATSTSGHEQRGSGLDAFGSESEPELLVTDLRGLLAELLSGDAPAQLRALAGNEPGAAPIATLAAFKQAMAFFERPTRERDLRALAARLSTIEQEQQLESEVERLRRRAVEEHQTPKKGPATPVARRRSLRKVLVGAAVVLGAGLGVSVAMWAPMKAGSVAAGSGSVTETGQEKGLIETLRDVARSALGTADPREPRVESGETPVATTRMAGRPRVGLDRASRPVPSVSAAAARPYVAGLSTLRLLPPRVTSAVPPELNLPQGIAAVFSRRDVDVHPPVLVRPHLPTGASVGLPGAQLGAVDVIVGVDGRVEQVRLVRTTAERRYYDAMILAAVKAWVFRPASKDGEPVRYRVQLTLT